tara:strand:- start:1639 stop:3753 length:2115 start_codon:yes stop_codon:yes gene_type:complete
MTYTYDPESLDMPYSAIIRNLGLTESDLDQDTDLYDSYPTRAANKVNLPEVTGMAAKFIYNYFTIDERQQIESGNQSLVLLTGRNTEEDLFRLMNENLPRYAEITFSPPAIDSSTALETATLIGASSPSAIERAAAATQMLTATLSGQNQSSGVSQLSRLVSRNIDKIVTEGATSNEIFTGIEFIDTNKETKIYTMLDASLTILNLNSPTSSKKESAQLLYETLEEKGGLEGLDKKLIVETLSNIQSSGYRYADTDVREEVAGRSNDPLGKQSFSVQFNNLLMADIVEQASIVSDNIFSDEIRATKEFAQEIKTTVLATIDSNSFREADYEMSVMPIDIREASVHATDSPSIQFIGYILEKYEVKQDESVTLIARKYIEGHSTQRVVDNSVRYGGSYFYKVRTLCLVQILAHTETSIGSASQNVNAAFLMASEGEISSIYCVENIPPRFPQSLKASFDFETLLPKLRWELPFNKQRDIKRFQIFKRLSVDVGFTLIAEIDFDNSIDPVKMATEVAQKEAYFKINTIQKTFTDRTHKAGEKPIYSVACVDAHGLSSNYSVQIMVERNSYTNIVKQTIISSPDAPKSYPNLFLNVDAFKDNIKTSGYDRVNLIFDPEYYDVFKGVQLMEKGQMSSREESLKLLAIDPANFRYKFQFINIDNQKDQVLKVKLQNLSSMSSMGSENQKYFETQLSSFNSDNASFQFGT